jgi:SAM-dependent methyltransferase
MWDQRYSEAGFAYGTEPNDFLEAEYSRIPKGGRVLCLAEGEGRNAVFLARLGYTVTAVDQSSVGLEKARKLAQDHGVEIETIVADLNDFDPGVEQWDGIVSIWAHVPEALRHKLHKQVVAALKNNGVFILEAYTVRHIDMEGVGGPPPEHTDFFMSLDTLYKELEGLEMVHAVEIDRMISEGNYHVGESAVVQVVARKPD